MPETVGSAVAVVEQIQRGKLHGSLDVSLAVMSINKKYKRIDLDAGDNLYHLKVRRTRKITKKKIFYHPFR